MDKKMDLVPLNTLMEMCMKETGSKAERQDKADSQTQMEMNTLEIGRMESNMVVASSHGTKVVQDMMVNGRMT